MEDGAVVVTSLGKLGEVLACLHGGLGRAGGSWVEGRDLGCVVLLHMNKGDTVSGDMYIPSIAQAGYRPCLSQTRPSCLRSWWRQSERRPQLLAPQVEPCHLSPPTLHHISTSILHASQLQLDNTVFCMLKYYSDVFNTLDWLISALFASTLLTYRGGYIFGLFQVRHIQDTIV
jgi:hypothetical protein